MKRLAVLFVLVLASLGLTGRGSLPWTFYYHSTVDIQVGLGANISYSVNVPRNGSNSVHPGINLQISDSASRIARFLTFGGDRYSGDPVTSRRNELSGSPSPFAPGAEIWAAYSYRVDAPADVTAPAINFQIHGSNDLGASPWVAFRVGGSCAASGPTLTVTSQFSTQTPAPITNPSATTRYTGTLACHTWHGIVVDALPGPTGTGALKIWIDGVQVLNLTSIAIGYTADAGSYDAFGFYRDPETTTNFTSVWYANMEVGTTDLSARITTPLAIQ